MVRLRQKSVRALRYTINASRSFGWKLGTIGNRHTAWLPRHAVFQIVSICDQYSREIHRISSQDFGPDHLGAFRSHGSKTHRLERNAVESLRLTYSFLVISHMEKLHKHIQTLDLTESLFSKHGNSCLIM